MIITKWEIYCIGFLLIALPFILTRAYWIKKSVKVNAVALSINKARSKRSASQTYPVFKYYTPDEIAVSSGNYNLPYKYGDTVVIRYNPDDVFNFRIDNFTGKWMDIIMWLSPILIVWTIIFLPRDLQFSLTYKDGSLKFKYR